MTPMPHRSAIVRPALAALLLGFIAVAGCAVNREAGSQPGSSSGPLAGADDFRAAPEALAAVAAAPQIGAAAMAATADDQPWSITVASWNLLNFGDHKAGLPPPSQRPALMTRMASIISMYNIVVLQEVLNGGASVTAGLAPFLPAYTCLNISAPAGRAGRPENYAVCYNNDANLAYGGAFDYLGNPYTALNGGVQTAQNIWMRPPAYVRFRYRKPDNTYFEFDVTTIHTKPQYSAGARPPGTPANAPKNASVRNELQSAQTNLQATYPKRILIGDLNADCVYYQPRFRGAEFNAWTWVIGDGVKTNTAQSSSCAYDRIILNPAIMADYQASGVYRLGINLRLDGRRVSDHYLVWARFGGVVKKKARKILSVSAASGVRKKRRLKRNSRVYLKGLNLAQPQAGKRPKLYITRYVKTRNFDSFNSFPLTDVRGAPTAVEITSSGDFQTPVAWTAQAAGLYNTVLDMNGDGVFRAADGDVANSNNEADLIVVPSGETHSLLASLDDNGNTRELFDADRAENVYAIARDLPASADVDLYVVASKLLPASFTSWGAMKAAGTLNLAAVAVPVLFRGGNLIRSGGGWTAPDARAAAALGEVALFQTITSDDDGGLFASAWSTPGLLFNGGVYTAPPRSYDVPDGVTLPDVPPNAEWDMCDDDVVNQYPAIAQACRAPSPAAGGQTADNGSTFPHYFGVKFNLVLDVNRNGVFDGPDLVDIYDIGDMTTFFAAGNRTLSPDDNGSPAIGEYKEFLDAHMNLNDELDSSNIYTDETLSASYRYNCSTVLSRDFFDDHLTPSAQTGFRVQNNEVYVDQVNQDSAYAYSTNVFYSNVDVNLGEACWSASNTAYYDGFHATSNTSVTVIAETHQVNNSVIADAGSDVCLTAADGLVLSATAAGAAGGALFGGPIGAAFGGAVGFIVGEVESQFVKPSCR